MPKEDKMSNNVKDSHEGKAGLGYDELVWIRDKDGKEYACEFNDIKAIRITSYNVCYTKLLRLPEDGDIVFVPMPCFDPLQHMHHKGEPFAAGRAPPAGFTGIEAYQVKGGGHHTGVLIKVV